MINKRGYSEMFGQLVSDMLCHDVKARPMAWQAIERCTEIMLLIGEDGSS
eukprot:gene16080-682_t